MGLRGARRAVRTTYVVEEGLHEYLVAAHNSDLVAASGCGLRTAFVARPEEHGPGQTSDLRPARPFDMIARDFGDLAEQLGC